MRYGYMYGSYRHLLPAFMQDRKLLADGRVRILAEAESRALERETLHRFPVADSEEIDWGSAPFRAQRRYFENEQGWAGELSDVLSPFTAEGSRTAVIWGNVVLPTVVAENALLIEHAEEIMDAHPAFWLHPVGSDTLVECLVDGRVTIAAIPPGGQDAGVC